MKNPVKSGGDLPSHMIRKISVIYVIIHCCMFRYYIHIKPEQIKAKRELVARQRKKATQ